MSIVGIIAEFNPLHTGHKYLLSQAKRLGTVVCAISGNFVQRGDTAIADKFIRARAALLSGADVVVELPVLWSMSTAQNFALGGVSALLAAGCDTLLFGSECGDVEALQKTAEILESEEFSKGIEKHLKKGVTFAVARQLAAEELGALKGILEGANNNLAIEYIIAAHRLGAEIQFKTVKRLGAGHDSREIDKFVSASLLREKLRSGDREFCNKYMDRNILELFGEDSISDIGRIESALLSVLRLKDKNELEALPDLSEGVENKLYSAIRLATDLDGLYNEIKVKRYTLSRIRRLVLSAVLGFDKEHFMMSLPYVRVLGFNTCGEEHIRNSIKSSAVPIIMRATEIEKLTGGAKKVFETEDRASNLFNLSLKKPRECGTEYTTKLIKERDENGNS